MTPVQLPEVPEPDIEVDGVFGHSDDQLRAYATEAVRLNAIPAVFIEQMEMLRDDFQKYSNGDKAVPFVVLREAIIAALNEWDEYTTPSEPNSDR